MSFMRKLFYYIIIYCLAFSVNSVAQNPGAIKSVSDKPLGQLPFFQHYTLLRKNEPVHVNVIFQDKKGYIWYGTDKGLFKFDGINQNRFRVSDGLPDENVTAIAEDSVGKICIGAKNGKLAF